MKLCFIGLIILISSVGLASAQIDPTVCQQVIGNDKLPAPPQRFHITMATVTQPGDLFGQVSIMVDSVAKKSAVTVENQVAMNESFKAIYDTTAWLVLLIDLKADPFQIDNCQVSTISSTSIQPMVQVSHNNVNRMVPTEGLLSPPAETAIQKGIEERVNGILSTPYRACYFDSAGQATVGLTWWYSAGAQSLIQVQSVYKFSTAVSSVSATYTAGPLRTMMDKHDATRHPFTTPKGVYCKNLVTQKQAPEPNNRFGFSVEEFVGISSGLPSQIEQPYNMHESYDQRNNITLMEGDSALFFATDKGKYGTGRLAKINDFTRGISYIKNIHFGNCTFDKIPEDGWDTNKTPGGPRLKSPADFYLPSIKQLQYKGSGVYRDTDVEIYIGYVDNYVDIGDGNKYPVAIEYYLQIKTFYDMEGRPINQSVPRAVYSVVPPPLRIYTMADVFDFNTGLPRAYDHDVSDCFSSTQLQHFEIIMTTADMKDESDIQYLKDHLDELLYSLVGSLARALNIAPLRILQPKVSLFAEPLILVEVTISDRANVQGYTPKQPEATLAEVVPKLTELVTNKRLFVQILEGETVFDVPVNDFVQMDARRTENTGSQGMSAGAAVGLAIGMLILGAVLAIAGLFTLNHFRKDPLFGFTPFGSDGAAA